MHVITTVMCHPDQEPVVVQVENSLAALQKAVEGNIEIFHLFENDVALITNEDGKLLRLPVNKVLLDKRGNPIDVLVGTILVVGTKNDEIISIPNEKISKYIDVLNDLYIRLS